MARYQGEEQALRFNAIQFYAGLFFVVLSVLILVGVSAIFFARTPQTPNDLIPSLASFLARWWLAVLSSTLFSARLFWRVVGPNCQKAALEIWDRQVANDRFQKVVRTTELLPASDSTKTMSAQRSIAHPSQLTHTNRQNRNAGDDDHRSKQDAVA